MRMEEKQCVKLYLQRLTRELRNSLGHSDVQQVITALETVIYLASNPQSVISPEPVTLDRTVCADLPLTRLTFTQNYYHQCLESVISHLSVDWVSALHKNKPGSQILSCVFLCGPPQESLLVLGNCIKCEEPGYKLNKITEILEKQLSGQLEDLLWRQCLVAPADLYYRQLWPGVINLLVVIPDHVTAKHGAETSGFFYPGEYIPHMSSTMCRVLKRVHDRLQQGDDSSVEFLGQLLGKLAITGHREAVWEVLTPVLEPLVTSSVLWCRLCERLVSNIPDRCLEAAILPFLTSASWYGTVAKFLGHSVLTNQKLRLLLTTKLLFHRVFKEPLVLRNILGYLSYSAATRHLLTKSLTSLLEVWGDASVTRHSPYEQHLYLSKAILVCLSLVNDTEKLALKSDLLPKLMTGMQCHLESAVHTMRRLGMVVAESVTSTLDPTGEQLKFEYEEDAETENLKALLQAPVDPGPISTLKSKEVLEASVTAVIDRVEKEEKSTSVAAISDPNTSQEEPLDSDDDFEPYDLSNDLQVTEVKKPVYLRDCMEGLISSEDPARLELCVGESADLIYKHRASVKEISVEFTKVLLHLQNNYAIPGFLAARHKAMVALAVVAPETVADYLTSQFFGRNYNIRQRMDMLEVLSSASQKLSSPTDDTSSGNHGNSCDITRPLIQDLTSERTSDIPHWKELVEKRIESKTRRFGKGQQRTAPKETVNRFAAVAGHFFFPLLNVFDRHNTSSCLDLLDSGHLLLSRLSYCLGTILYAATNTLIVRQMSRGMLEFVWALRYHPQPSVRQSLLFCVCMTALSVPPAILFSDLQAELLDTKQWLQEVVERDSDTGCQQMAVDALLLMEKALKQEYNQTAEVS